ncbi:hypothetical protein GCM10027346_38120 [Hymenobacter seoulensis]
MILRSSLSRLLIAVLGSAAALTLGSCQKETDAPATETGSTVTMQLEHVVGQPEDGGGFSYRPLELDAVSYKNANGDDFTVSTFKYYLSNLTLHQANGTAFLVPDSYFLVDQAKAASRRLTLGQVPAGEYTSLSFVVGVDSARTKAGNFTGVLNADNGMFWEMNGPEFINLKLEGRSPQSPTTALVFHVAGYKGQANNTIRTVELPFPAARLLVHANRGAQLQMRVDVGKLFTGPNPRTTTPPPFLNPVSFATVYNKMSGPAVAKLADNIADGMFTVTQVQSE